MRPTIDVSALAGFVLVTWALAFAPAASAATMFTDGFESGTLSTWTSVSRAGTGSATVQNQVVRGGAYAASLSSSSDASSVKADDQ